MSVVLIFARLTIKETQRRRILWVGLVMGIAFLALYGLGFHFIMVEFERALRSEELMQAPITFLILAGILATNFLVIVLAVLLSVGAVSGEIADHTMDTMLTKPIRRWQIIVGKWLGFALLLLCGVLLLPGGIMLTAFLRAGIALDNILGGLALMYLEGMVMMSVAIAGGTRLTTMANGALAFMLYGLGFVGSWVEQVGALLQNETAVDIGILSSLISPTEVLWRKATILFQPRIVSGLEFAGPFAIGSEPNNFMIGYAITYMLCCLLLAIWGFSRRDL